VHLLHLTNNTSGVGEEYSYVARPKKAVYPKGEKAKKETAPPVRKQLEEELKRLEAAPMQLRNFQV